jgi:hypothetical protein
LFTNFKFVKQLRINVDNKNFALGKNIGHFRNIPCHQGDNIKLRHLYCHLKACGDGGKTTTPQPLILLEFKHFYDFFSFSKNSENYHQKDLKRSIKIKIAI